MPHGPTARQLPQTGGFVGAPRDQPFAVRGDRRRLHGTAVAAQHGKFFVRGYVPETGRLILVAADEPFPLADHGKRRDGSGVAFKEADDPAGVQIP